MILRIVYTLIVCVLLYSCGTTETSELLAEMRDDLVYLKGADKPYSGVIVGYYRSYIDTTGDTIVDLKFRKKFKNGLLEGKSEEWFSNGQIQTKGTHSKGLRNGMWQYWFDNGHVLFEAAYKDGQMNGIMKEYYDNGQLWAEYIYKEGLPWESVHHYFKDGSEVGRNTLKNGNGKLYIIDEGGEVLESTEYEDGHMINSESFK